MIYIDNNPLPAINAVRMSAVCAEAVLTSLEIDNIGNIINGLELSSTTINNTTDKLIRSCNVTWIPYNDDTSWIYGRLYDLGLWLNDEAFKLKPLDMTEHIMYCEYKEGDGFDWHVDTGDVFPFCSRKLAFTIQLSSSDEYRGGCLEFATSPNKEHHYTMPRSKGSIIAYPTYLTHRVQPITKGIRKSLVFWLGGAPFQ